MRIVMAFFVSLCPALMAQSWSVTASAPTPGTAVVGSWGGGIAWQTLPVGPVAAGTFLAISNNSGTASASWAPNVSGQTAPLAFTAATTVVAVSQSTSVPSSAGVNAQLDLSLRAPQPLSGRLVVQWSVAGSFGGSARINLDVDADGTVDFAASSFGGSGTLDLPLQIPLAGAVVRVIYTASASASQGSYSTGTASVAVQFFPNQPDIRVFDTTGAGQSIGINHPIGDSVTLSLNTSNQMNVLCFGFQPMVNPLLPTVTQLISIDAYFVASSVTMTLPPLPPGTALYSQGLVIDWLGNLRSTSSVRALWP